MRQSSTQRLRAMLERQHAEIARHEQGARLATDPEDLHQVRVAVRRARALLRAVRPMVDTSRTEPLRAELKWLGGALGPRRDLDVLVARLRDRIGELDEPERGHSQSLIEALETDRRAAQAHVAEALTSYRYRRLLSHLGAAATALELDPPDASLRELAARDFKRLRKAMDSLADDAADGDLHRVRILGKRARYTAELAESEVGRRAARFVAEAKRFQDVLGAHQDAVVAEARLRELLGQAAGGKGAAFAAGLLVERERLESDKARLALGESWKRLERRGRRAWF